jgi:pyruvate kinase
MNPEPQTADLNDLIAELTALRTAMLAAESSMAPLIARLHPSYRPSATNLVHYMAVRQRDIRPLQDRLSALGLSSLGRAEANIQANVEAVLQTLHRLAGSGDSAWPATADGYRRGKLLLGRHTEDLLGSRPAGRSVRIMVTMPTEAATQPEVIEDLMRNGMDCLRINCAHDGPEVWALMVTHLRRAERALGKKCRVLMDLGGPKLRTGPLAPGPEVVRWKPQRDALGRVKEPARIWLYPAGSPIPVPVSAAAAIPVPSQWLAQSKKDDVITLRDTRDRFRRLTITEEAGDCRWAEADRTAYVQTGTRLELHPRAASHLPPPAASVQPLPPQEQCIRLKKGDRLLLTRSLEPGRPALHDAQGGLLTPARIGCTLPDVFKDVRPGERVFLDDGKIGGIARSATPDLLDIEITHARPTGERLRADKGINFPDSRLTLPALTPKDVRDLEHVIELADMVGFSFVRSSADVGELESHLDRLGGKGMGIVLKIETREAFERIPELLLASMLSPGDGVMIARGDLAIECGYERLAEVQEEILCICEAAHVPVIWATQVLETMAKQGAPSRAEVTDAAMANRAECVMLNKGPHVIEAVRALDGILRRMETRQSKKRALMGPLGVV